MGDARPIARLAPPSGASRPPAAGGTAPLTRAQKAAIVVQLLLNEGADVPLTTLPEALQEDLTQLMGSIRRVDRDTLAAVVQEFAAELDSVGLSFPKGLAGALSQLDGRISPRTAERLRREAGVREAGDPWDRIRGTPVDDLRAVVERESPEVAAVMLSKLDVAQAAALLGKLPGEVARRITYAVSLTGQVTPEAVDRIGLSLAAQLNQRKPRAFTDDPSDRVGAILNVSLSGTRDAVLTGLEEDDRDFAEEVRRRIFTFANIGERIAEIDVPRIARAVEQSVLVRALAAAQGAGPGEAASAEFILSNMSQRLADNIREEIAALPAQKPADGEQAMTDVVGTIRALQETGDIEVKAAEDD